MKFKKTIGTLAAASVIFLSCVAGTSNESAQEAVTSTSTENTPEIEQPTVEVIIPQVEESTTLSEEVKEQPTSILTEPPAEKNVVTGNPIVEEELEDVPAKASHSKWDALLKKHVTASGKVNYKTFKTDLSALKAYLAHLEANQPASDWSRNEKLAYWINLYNASTVKLILDNYPLSSIMKIDKAWDKPFIPVGGKKKTLNNIENDIIRPRFKEPLIHFGVNCAAVSCPKLLNAAYTPANVITQLTGQAKKFINDPANNTISAGSVKVSKIFEWYKGDFTAKGSLVDYLNKYSKVKINSNAKVGYKEYNWELNE